MWLDANREITLLQNYIHISAFNSIEWTCTRNYGDNNLYLHTQTHTQHIVIALENEGRITIGGVIAAVVVATHTH